MTSNEDEEILRLLELQRRELEILKATQELEGDIYDDDDDDDENGTRHLNLRPTVPDMRFEKQFERTVEGLKSNGASNMTIFLSAVVKDQVIMQFFTGFTWCLAGHVWKWYRLRGQRVNNKESFVFLRGVKHGLTRWASTAYSTLVNIPALTTTPTPAYPVE
ncbi:hypothetical protein BC941DRAFT_425396 [Chlamydoabsidia padenii]|nr:hypothetical protein BC941DRAFT_425396 [Chlamydoabsidia padenii]